MDHLWEKTSQESESLQRFLERNFGILSAMIRSFLMICFLMGTAAQAEDFIVSVGGDVNFTTHQALPNEEGFLKYGQKVSFEKMTAGIVGLLRGADVNFANIETVVTDRSDLEPQSKAYNFQTHPNALLHLTGLGFNLFSLANNHAHDFGVEGIEETLKHMRAAQENETLAYSGLGDNLEQATQPAILTIKGVRIALIAIGNTPASFSPTATKAGALSYGNEAVLRKALKKLREAQADLRFVSVHNGTERQIELDRGQRDFFHRLLREGRADVVIGHHPHVVRPVEYVNGKVIFYSLGNYMMAGAGNMDAFGPSRDYGLFAKMYFKKDDQGFWRIRALSAVPLTQMHRQPQQMKSAPAQERIQILNQLSADQLGATGVEFEIEPQTGTGVWLAPH